MGSREKLLFVSVNRMDIPYPVYPLGLAYLSTALKQKLPDFEIRQFDFNLDDEAAFINEMSAFDPDYVAVSLRNIDGVNSYDPVNFLSGYDRIMQLIEKKPERRIIMGGSGFSIFPEILFNHFKPDFGICGEGEDALYRLISSIEAGTDISEIEGLVYSKDDRVIVNGRRHFFTGINLRFDDKLTDFYWKKSGMLNIQTKRGCPFNCIYCTYPIIEGRKVRTLDPDTVVDTLSELYYSRGIDYIFFTDSVFNVDNEYNARLAENIIKSGINIKWGGYFYPKGLTLPLLQLLKRSGLMHIEFGTESICDETLEKYGKHFTAEDVIGQSALCREADIHYCHFLILGGYGETEKTIDTTYENSRRIAQTVFFPFVGMRIYPGTKLYDIALAEGRITADDQLLEPKYYLSDQIDVNTLRARADLTGRRWSFPDEDVSSIIKRIRDKRDRKGPLWEFMII